MDISSMAQTATGDSEMDVARKALRMKRLLKQYQDSFTAIEKVTLVLSMQAFLHLF